MRAFFNRSRRGPRGPRGWSANCALLFLVVVLARLLSSQAAAAAILYPPYCSPELQQAEQLRHRIPLLLKGNDVWMLGHVLMVLSVKPAMPKRNGKTDYLGETSGAADFHKYVEKYQELKERLERPMNAGLRFFAPA
jgi:hypothetical protein